MNRALSRLLLCLLAEYFPFHISTGEISWLSLFSLVYLFPSYFLSVTAVVIVNINYSRLCYCTYWDCSSFRFQYYYHSDAKSPYIEYTVHQLWTKLYIHNVIIFEFLQNATYFDALKFYLLYTFTTLYRNTILI